MSAGGYDDERWWDTEAGRTWRSGEGTAEGMKTGARWGLKVIREKPHVLEEWHDSGQIDDALYERWQRRLAMSEAELEVHLTELYPGGRLTEPRHWREEPYHNPAQPVVGVCWYEARAYCAWLSAQTGLAFRLPTEVEWEAAARGSQGRPYAYGDDFDPLRDNTLESHLRRPSPVGVFVEGATPEGLADMSGNVGEWTNSLWGQEDEEPEYGYPYRAEDGREDAEATPEGLRVVRGGSWNDNRRNARCAYRYRLHPNYRLLNAGFRVVLAPPTLRR
jgi:formylglycine-generating enzyme required for sulfatase activity